MPVKVKAAVCGQEGRSTLGPFRVLARHQLATIATSFINVLVARSQEPVEREKTSFSD